MLGRHASEPPPDLLVCVVDATNLRLNLRLVLELKRLGRPLIVALNMSDLARSRGYRSIAKRSSARSACRSSKRWPCSRAASARSSKRSIATSSRSGIGRIEAPTSSAADIEATQREVRRILDEVGYRVPARLALLTKLDARGAASGRRAAAARGRAVPDVPGGVQLGRRGRWTLIEAGVGGHRRWLGSTMSDGPLRSLLVDGVIAGAGSVLVFLPQILILFFFILVLEDSGYLPRAAFLLDRLMGKVGLSGRAFIPLLSSFACAIPGIMATRTIPSPRDRIATIMIAPLMTCSARLPVYALLIGAFIPARTVGGIFNLQGLVLFALYLAGVLGAMVVAFVLKLTVMRGAGPRR